METLGQILATGGLLGMLLVGIFGFIVFLALPIAAIIDCAASKVQGGAKAFIIVVLVLTWGAFSLIYCLFFAQARWLRRVTLVVILLGLVTIIGSCGALFKGSHILQEKQAAREAEERRLLIDAFNPATIEPGDITPFKALYVVSSNAHSQTSFLTTFTLDGPDVDTGIAIDAKIRDIATSPDRCYAITDHAVGTLSRDSGQFVPIDLKAVFPGFSWAAGITYVAESQRIVVLTSHVHNRFYSYAPGSGEWAKLEHENREGKLTGLAFHPEQQALFAIEEPAGEGKVSRLARFDLAGNLVGYVQLQLEIPIARSVPRPSLQIHASSGQLVLLVPHHSDDRVAIYVVAIETGEVKRGDSRNRSVDASG